VIAILILFITIFSNLFGELDSIQEQIEFNSDIENCEVLMERSKSDIENIKLKISCNDNEKKNLNTLNSFQKRFDTFEVMSFFLFIFLFGYIVAVFYFLYKYVKKYKFYNILKLTEKLSKLQ
jgi:hypothetical protein